MCLTQRLSRASSFAAGDLLYIFSADNNDPRLLSQSAFLEWLDENFAASSPATQKNSPVNGFNLAVNDNGTSTHLLLTPAGTLATGTILLPTVTNAVDGQVTTVSSSQTITALTLDGNGATIVGGPTTIGATSPFQLKFDSQSDTWNKV